MGSQAKPEVAAAATGKSEAQLAERAKILEGVDFVETEEDAEAVESAVVKIQSTFRGKKIRSKFGAKKEEPQTTATATTAKKEDTGKKGDQTLTEAELSAKVAGMQVEDNKAGAASSQDDGGERKQPAAAGGGGNVGQAETEAERAATKIQAGFKGYKTRKELEGKLGGSGGGQQGAPAGADK